LSGEAVIDDAVVAARIAQFLAATVLFGTPLFCCL